MLAAELKSPGSSTVAPTSQHAHPPPQPPRPSAFPSGQPQGGIQTYNPTYQPPQPPAGPPPGWQGIPPPQQPQPAQPVQRKPIAPSGPPPGHAIVEAEPKNTQPPTSPPGVTVHAESAPKTPTPLSGQPPPASSLPDLVTLSLSEMAITDKGPTDPWKIVRVNADPSKMPRRTPPQTVSTNVALARTLVSAVSTGKHSMAEQLLNRGVSPNLEGDRIALVEAVAQNDLTNLRLLLEFGADPNLKPTDGFPALRYACQRGQEEEARLLLSYGADPNIISKLFFNLFLVLISVISTIPSH